MDEGYYIFNLFISDRLIERLENEHGIITDEDELETALQSYLDDVGLSDIAQRYINGKWIEHIEVGYSGAKYFHNNCSICGCLAVKKDSEKYCHNCGAKMD